MQPFIKNLFQQVKKKLSKYPKKSEYFTNSFLALTGVVLVPTVVVVGRGVEMPEVNIPLLFPLPELFILKAKLT